MQLSVIYVTNRPWKAGDRIKRLRELTRPLYRLRVDDVRVFYDIVEDTVEIFAVVAKRHAAEWLEREGVPTELDTPADGEE